MILRYDLGGSGLRLLDGEHLEVFRTGAFELWRVHRSPLVGRFAGHLDPAVLASLRHLVEAAAAASAGTPPAGPEGPRAEVPLPPGTRAERWQANEATLTLAEGRVPIGPWGELLAAARPLLDSLTNRPTSAVELIVGDDWRSAMLHHRGREPMAIDPTSLRLDVAAWRSYFDLIGTWESGPLDARTATIGPGWSLDLELGHRFRPGPGRVLHVTASFDVYVGEHTTHLKAEVAPPMEQPAEELVGETPSPD